MSIYCGVDPGTATTGYAFIESSGRSGIRIVDYGVIETPASASQLIRLPMIAEDFSALLDQYRPDACGMEKLFFATNRTTALSVAESRGVLSYLLAIRWIRLYEYAPAEMKKAITGNGRADKEQIRSAMGMVLQLDSLPGRDDSIDALAMAYLVSLSDRGVV